jgi:hypothetical protein
MRRTLAVLTLAGVAACLALASPATGGPEAKDSCVQGSWRMSTAESNAFLRRLIPTGNISVVSGVLTASFPRSGNATYGSNRFVVQVAAGDLVLKGTASFRYTAPWETRGGKLLVGAGRSELRISQFTATRNGQTITVPGQAPTIKRTPRGATPYTCTSTTLRWKVPLNNTWARFRRA